MKQLFLWFFSILAIPAMLLFMVGIAEEADEWLDLPVDEALQIDEAEIILSEDLFLLEVSPQKLRLGTGETYSMNIDDAQFSSSDERVASVNEKGVIEARRNGKATVTAMYMDTVIAAFRITVLDPPDSVSLSKTTLKMYVNDTRVLTARLPKKTASNKLTWSSSNESIATVSADGEVTALSAGTVMIGVTTFNGKHDTCTVEVQTEETATDISFSEKSVTIGLGESLTVIPEISGGYVMELNWHSSDSDTVSVDQSGLITGKKVGKAKIRVTTQKKLTASMVVNVRMAPDKVSLPGQCKVAKGQSIQLDPALPSKTASYSRVWTCSDSRVATVDEHGLVNGLMSGTAVITFSTFNGQTASCEVIVTSQSGIPEPLSVLDDAFEYDLSHMRRLCPRVNNGYQDIAIYNGIIFGFDRGSMFVNGGTFSIENGHGNNCMFGNVLHGQFPYLYCASWERDNCKVFVNQISGSGATLVRTISYPSLKGYLNCCVDEANQLIYILLNTSAKTREGIVDFIVSDFDGNILSRRCYGYLPAIQGMTFFGDRIYVLSGYGNTRFPNRLSILDTSGTLVGFSTEPLVSGENEGIDFYGDTIFIATRTGIYMQ